MWERFDSRGLYSQALVNLWTPSITARDPPTSLPLEAPPAPGIGDSAGAATTAGAGASEAIEVAGASAGVATTAGAGASEAIEVAGASAGAATTDGLGASEAIEVAGASAGAATPDGVGYNPGAASGGDSAGLATTDGAGLSKAIALAGAAAGVATTDGAGASLGLASNDLVGPVVQGGLSASRFVRGPGALVGGSRLISGASASRVIAG